MDRAACTARPFCLGILWWRIGGSRAEPAVRAQGGHLRVGKSKCQRIGFCDVGSRSSTEYCSEIIIRVILVLMDSIDRAHLEALSSAVRALSATGDTGFEGLIATVMSQIAEQPFRLASSGTQRGRDGDSAFDEGATYFEAKHYQDEVAKKEVTGKLSDVQIDDVGQVDLWVLASTARTSSQHARDYRTLAGKIGIGIVILDWSDVSIPPLAIALTLSKKATTDFLRANLTNPMDKALVAPAAAAMERIESMDGWDGFSLTLRKALTEATVGPGLAKAANKAWLEETFSNRTVAYGKLGQPLAPLDPKPVTRRARSQVYQLAPAFSGQSIDMIFAIIGDEGAGKSWLAAEGWLASDPQPLMIICTGDELFGELAQNDIEGFIIAKLAQQTDSSLTEVFDTRWRRRFKAWRHNPRPANVRLTMVIDGLNQQPNAHWGRRVEAATDFLRRIGGKLVITTRSTHFSRIRDAIMSPLKRVIVDDWTKAELEKLLRGLGIDPDRLSADVFSTLRNPRMFGLAIELLDAHDIEAIEELSVPRLLFEHSRRAQAASATVMSGQEFASKLREIAKEYVARVERQMSDDVRLFKASDEALQVVLDTRFFRTVSDEPGEYEIEQDGLNLALGLWLVNSLEREERNGRDPSEKLAQILQPVLALDEVARVVEAALHAACIKDITSTAVQAALIEYYVALQNLPEDSFKPFVALGRRAPHAFLLAAEHVFEGRKHTPNSEWLSAGLVDNRDDPSVWKAIKETVPVWLSYYSLAPERLMFKHSGQDSEEQVAQEKARRQQVVDRRVADLTDAERGELEKLEAAPNPHFAELQRLALMLLAGRPLAEFAGALRNWAFSDALNSSLQSPHKEFEALIRFNAVDWADTRNALLKAIAPFETAGQRSNLGAWTIVYVLRATGSVDDAVRAQSLAAWLTRDRPHYGGFSRAESYSATDPCNPAAIPVDNVKPTANAYGGLDVSRLSTTIGRTTEDLFFIGASPAMARFAPEAGSHTVRALAEHVLGRTGFDRRQGVVSLLPHSAAIGQEAAQGFLKAALSREAAFTDDRKDRDAWLTAQYSLFIALPYLTGNEQIAAIAEVPGTILLLQMMRALKKADEATVEYWLKIAQKQGDAELQLRILAVIHYSRPPLSDVSVQLIAGFVDAPHEMVRTQALGIAANTELPLLLERVAESGWDAHDHSSRSDTFELWYGSSALVAAAKSGLLTPEQAFKRLQVGHFGFLAEVSKEAAALVAEIVDRVLISTLELTIDTEIPDIGGPSPKAGSLDPPLVSLEERRAQPTDAKSALDRMNESDEEFDDRQRRAGRAYDRFRSDVQAAEAELVLEDLTVDGVIAIADAFPDKAERWLRALLGATEQQLQNLFDFAYEVASAEMVPNTAAAIKLLRRLEVTSPRVNRSIGHAELPTVAISAWSSAELPQLKAYLFGRLDRARSDEQISIEVVAAISAVRDQYLTEYVEERVCSGEPGAIARALMVAGFRDKNPHSDEILRRDWGTEGFLAKAANTARNAYDRNAWAQVWHEKMINADSPLEFWRFSVLFNKIVDARYELWMEKPETGTQSFQDFRPTIDDALRRRIGKWRTKRRKELFGDSVPAPIFVQRG